jgi:phage terminase Nu1 subunit (DNA packaging protein)
MGPIRPIRPIRPIGLICPIIFTTLNYYNYFTEIEETFVRRRGKHLLLSPIDWAMIEGWQERGIPLHIVIRAIEGVFDGYDKNPGPRSIKGLLYCREEVEAQFLEWSAMQAGKAKEGSDDSGELSVEQIVEHIESVTETLQLYKNPALREDIDRAITRMKELAANHSNDVETADHALSDIESLLEHALLTKTDKTRLTEFQKEITGQLRPYKAEMTPESYDQTARVMLLKRLRDEEGIPRLSLFYL